MINGWVEVFCGTIASGKSTLATERAKNGWIIINDDDIVKAVHGGNYQLYQECLKPLYKSVENHILQFAVGMGRNVVIDRGLNLNKKSRSRWISLAKSLDRRVRAVVFEITTPEIHAKRRVESDNRGHSYEFWLNAVEQHVSIYEPPTVEEGFDEIGKYKWV